MNRPPDFDELMEGIESPEERDRLLRVHELLVASGPPPELSPALASSPGAPPAEEEEPDTSWLPPRRIGAAILVGAALAASAFGIGYVVGNDSGDAASSVAPPAQPARVISLRPSDQNNTSGASIRLGHRGADGNWPMALTVRGLDQLSRGNYYALVLTRKGKPVVTCGTFNVAPTGSTTVEMIAAYDLQGFDGWAITQYDNESHRDWVVMSETA